ncbi:hypothetical protein [Streptomyces sp. NPDC006334]|uniref:hypothetical protein n=1 Tax=Streptomyces sp. NPDC006334 TaxID=3156754 RepID=UPI0033BB6317
MRLSKALVTGVTSLALLTAVTGCGSDSAADKDGSSSGKPSAGAEAGKTGLPSAKTLREVQAFISGAGLPCDNLTDDEGAKGTPAEGFLGPADQHDDEDSRRKADAWAISKSGFCGETRSDTGGWVIYLPKDMKTFQENYRNKAQEAAKDGGWKGKLARGKFYFGADFVLDPTNYRASKTLLESGLLMENCDPNFKAPEGYRTQDALASGCVLTNYLADPLDQ